MPNWNNNGVRRRYWRRWVKAQQIGDPVQRSIREMYRNPAFARYMLKDYKPSTRWTRFLSRLRRLWQRITRKPSPELTAAVSLHASDE